MSLLFADDCCACQSLSRSRRNGGRVVMADNPDEPTPEDLLKIVKVASDAGADTALVVCATINGQLQIVSSATPERAIAVLEESKMAIMITRFSTTPPVLTAKQPGVA